MQMDRLVGTSAEEIARFECPSPAIADESTDPEVPESHLHRKADRRPRGRREESNTGDAADGRTKIIAFELAVSLVASMSESPSEQAWSGRSKILMEVFMPSLAGVIPSADGARTVRGCRISTMKR